MQPLAILLVASAMGGDFPTQNELSRPPLLRPANTTPERDLINQALRSTADAASGAADAFGQGARRAADDLFDSGPSSRVARAQFEQDGMPRRAIDGNMGPGNYAASSDPTAARGGRMEAVPAAQPTSPLLGPLPPARRSAAAPTFIPARPPASSTSIASDADRSLFDAPAPERTYGSAAADAHAHDHRETRTPVRDLATPQNPPSPMAIPQFERPTAVAPVANNIPAIPSYTGPPAATTQPDSNRMPPLRTPDFNPFDSPIASGSPAPFEANAPSGNNQNGGRSPGLEPNPMDTLTDRHEGSYFMTLLALFASVGLNLYLGWIAYDTYNRYQDLVSDMRSTGNRGERRRERRRFTETQSAAAY